LDECFVIPREPRKAHTFVMDEGIGKLETTYIFVGFSFYPFINHMPQENNLLSLKTTFS
jgi:hypothetical protein